jgi:mandelate racemase
MPVAPNLTIRGLQVRAVNVPMTRPLVTSGGTVQTAPLVLIDLQTEEGVVGRAYVFCYTALALEPTSRMVKSLESLVKGEPVAPLALEQKLGRAFRLLGPQGLVGMALAGLDMAAWDALARAAGWPLARLLGGEPRPIPAYNSCGLGILGAERAAEEALELLEPGFRAVKIRLGYPEAWSDLEVVRAVRQAVGPDVVLMSDYNQALSVTEAMRRAHLLDDEGLAWIEEPTLAVDFLGHGQVRREARTPIQIGENFWGPPDMAKSLAAGASDYVMPDVVKIGGVSGWLRAAALAEAASLPMSCHLFPELSAHLLAVTPTCHWLEYVDWASPILAEPVQVADGHITASTSPGNGLAWDEDAVRRYLVEP